MTNKNKKYSLSFSQLEQALAILDEEKETLTPTRLQEILFTFFSVIVVVSFILLIILLIVSSILVSAFLVSDSDTGIFFNENAQTLQIMYILGVSYMGIVLIFFALFFANVPLYIKYWRSSRLIRKLGLNQVLSDPWKKESRKINVQNIIGAGLSLFGLCMISFSTLLVLSFLLSFTEPDMGMFDLLFPLTIFTCAILGFIPIYMINKSRQRVKVIKRLQDSLVMYKYSIKGDNVSKIDIPREDYELLAKIERAQITRNQAESIRENLDGLPFSDISILKSRAFRESFALLNDSEKLIIEKQIDELETTVKNHGKEVKSQTKILDLHGLDKPLGICYQIDDNQIKLISLQEIPSE